MEVLPLSIRIKPPSKPSEKDKFEYNECLRLARKMKTYIEEKMEGKESENFNLSWLAAEIGANDRQMAKITEFLHCEGSTLYVRSKN